MSRDLIGPPIHAVLQQCDDTQGDPEQSVVLRRIKGIPPSQALFSPGFAQEKTIYVPNGVNATIKDLPPKVRELILHR